MTTWRISSTLGRMMKKRVKAKFPFEFFSRLHLRQLTGLKAATLPQLLHHLKTVPGSVIYHHTHHFLEQHQRMVPSVPNDFAYWVTEVMGEGRLGEQLSAIDTITAPSIWDLRESIVAMIDDALKAMPALGVKMAPSGQKFYFMSTMSFVFKTPYKADSLEEFANCLKKVTLTSIYYHIFESRLRHERATNDFSSWLKESLDETELAEKISRLNPYDYSLEGLRQKMVDMVHARVAGR